MNLLKIFGRKSLPKVAIYSTIDAMPCGRWNSVNESNDTRFLYVELDDQRKETNDTIAAWFAIQDQIVKKFGFSPNHLAILRRMRKAQMYRIKATLTGRPDLVNFAEIEEKAIEEMKKNGKSLNFTESVAILERELGFHIDTESFSTLKYLQHINLLNRQNV